MKPTLLITGAAGFLGQAFLSTYGHQFTCTAMGRTRPAGPASRVDWIEHDLRQPLDEAVLPTRIDLVLHLASARMPSPGAGVDELYAINVASTAALAAWAVKAGARRVVFGSTGGIYGYRRGPIRESHTARPFDTYTLTKWQGEMAARFHAPGRVGIVRYFFPYGPGQVTGLIPRLASVIQAGQPVALYANGRHPRLNPVFVDDATELTRRVLMSRREMTVNCAGPETVQMPQLAGAIAALTGVPARFVESVDPAIGDMVGHMTHARDLLRFRPRTGIAAGLARTLGTG